MEQVITISREFGSGGREIGFLLAERLGIPFYDKEIIFMAAEDTDIAEEVIDAHDEVMRVNEQAHRYHSINPFSNIYEVPVSDQIFVAQSQVIKKLAVHGPCVIIGRCSDMILDHSFDVFICSSMKKRIERLEKIETEFDPRKMESHIRQIDAKRRDYYQYYSGNEWGNPRNYHISLNSGRSGISPCVDVIEDMLKKVSYI